MFVINIFFTVSVSDKRSHTPMEGMPPDAPAAAAIKGAAIKGAAIKEPHLEESNPRPLGSKPMGAGEEKSGDDTPMGAGEEKSGDDTLVKAKKSRRISTVTGTRMVISDIERMVEY